MGRKLHHVRQIAVKAESTPGTEETSFAVGDLVRVRDLTIEQNPQYFERPVHTRSWGYTPRRQENTWCEISFAVELTGHTGNTGGTWANSPVFSRLLAACGLEEVAGYDVDVGAISGGPFIHGEVISDNPSSPTEAAICVGRYYTGVSKIYVEDLTVGTSFTAGIEGGSSGATATAGTEDGDAQAGLAWVPDTDSTATATIRFRNDGDEIQVYGCRGDVTIDCQSQDIALLRFTIQGIYSETVSQAMIQDFLPGAYPEQTPPTFVDAALALTGSDGSSWAVADLNFTEAQFSIGNNVTMRQNSNSSSGWLAAHIAQRTPNGRFNPDDPNAATYNLREKFKDNVQFALSTSWGSTEGNSFMVQAPAIELDSVGDGERDELSTFDLSFRCTRGFDAGADGNQVGFDNELILFNL